MYIDVPYTLEGNYRNKIPFSFNEFLSSITDSKYNVEEKKLLSIKTTLSEGIQREQVRYEQIFRKVVLIFVDGNFRALGG